MTNWFCVMLLSSFLFFLHPFYISMTDINFNQPDKELEISVRIFTDDFENTLRKNHANVNIDLLHPTDKDQMNEFVQDYIQKNVSITINGTAETMTFSGYEQQQESIWAYFEIKGIASVQKLEINNALLYDFTNNQTNMIHVKANGKEQTSKLIFPDKNADFNF